jgi:uncharacterized protein (TIGR03083 family)
VPTSLTFDEHVDALQSSGERLLAVATEAGLGAPVPTCPAWTVRALVAHQAMVHRWASAHVRGDDPDAVPNQTWIRSNVDDLPGYYREGLGRLVSSLRAAPADLVALRFLNDAPPARDFWARRQAHETTIHMVDALAARLAAVPAAAAVGIDSALAVDGVDELLCGFFTRGKSKLYDGSAYTIEVACTDVDRRWLLEVGPTLTVSPDRGPAADAPAAATLTGTAAGVYLALWNRGDAVTLDGRADMLDRWRATQRVRWS